jgi:ribonuclease R
VTRPPPPFPTKDQLLDFIRDSPTPVGRREITRAFRISGDDRVRLKALLKDLEADGAVERGRKRQLAPPRTLPEVAVIETTGTDADGECLARPLHWQGDDVPRIFVMPDPAGQAALGPGERVLARLRRSPDGTYEARVLRRLLGGPATVVGIYEYGPRGARVRPSDRRQKTDYALTADGAGDAEPGDLVLAEVLPATRLGLRQVRIVERLGVAGAPRTISLIAIHQAGIPTQFPPAALVEAEGRTVPDLRGREDLRAIPLVTIDGADARDFDDAVFAEPDDDPANPGGWRLLVAIADVAHYVRPGSALDREARNRGNSCYFPDRVVPMLPEALSNGLCSLVPGEPRACLAVRMRIDARGDLVDHAFVRGLMRSAARLTYEQVQAAIDGTPDDTTASLLDAVIRPLLAAHRALAAARARRGTLDLDLPERVIRLDPQGRVATIDVRRQTDAHRLIEEFMILANVAAATELERRGVPCVYRIHDQPDALKLEGLRPFLEAIGYGLAKGALVPAHFTHVLKAVAGRPEALLVNELILRAQAQAAYDPENIGHFGLALRRYAHFTSPIRRYADLLVHRGLVRALKLGSDGLTDEGVAEMEKTAAHVSMTERRAAEAERDAIDRYTAAHLAERTGETFGGRISGVTRFGIFVRLDGIGADGLVPVSALPDDFYEHLEDRHALVGTKWGRIYRLGARVEVRVVDADPLARSLLFGLVGSDGADLPGLPPVHDLPGRRRSVPTRGRGSRPRPRG